MVHFSVLGEFIERIMLFTLFSSLFCFIGEGERAGIELVSVSDGGEENHSMGAIADLTSNHLVTFPPLNPHSFYMRQIIIHNSA